MPIPPGSLELELDAANYSGSGTAWPDGSGNGNDYTLVNPIFNSNFGGYFSFVSPGDGSITNYAYKNTTGPLTTAQTDWTMQAWINVPAQPPLTADGITIFTNGNEGPGYGYYMSIQWAYYAFTGRMPGINIPTTAGYFATDSADAFPTDAWTLMTITVDSSNNLKIYFNNTLIETFTGVSMGFAPSASAQLYVGTNNPSLYYSKAFNGDIAVIRFYTAALDSADIANQYTSEVGRFTPLPPVTGLSNGRRFGQGFPQ